MNILVVGGAGYIGGAITDILETTDHNTRVYDCLMYEESYRKPIDFVYGDVRDRQRLSEQLAWADAVIWLAALVGDGACAINPQLSAEINQYCVKWLSENYDGRIIFTSTCSVYGAQKDILTEESLTDPLSIYAITKLAAEEYLKSKNALVFRLGTLFGVSDLFARLRLDLVVNILDVGCGEGIITAMLAEKNLNVIGCDYSTEAINIAKKHHPHIAFIYSNSTSLAFDAQSFTKVTMSDVAEHLMPVQLINTLLEINRVLKPGGQFILATPITGKGNNTSTYAHIYEYSENEM